MHQVLREELLRLLLSVELPECVKQPLYEAGVMRALEDYEEEGVLTGYEVDPNAFTVGTPGNTPASVAAITAVRKEMNDNKVAMAGRMAVLDTAADAKLLELDAFNSVGHTGETSAIINAQLGRKFGFDFYMDQNICKHENGDLSVTPTMKLSAIVSADSNVATFTDGSLTGKIKGTTDKFSRPSSHICTVLSS